ncbi:MAG: hypothetical protein K8I60_11435 [Anaerolineae bacterium]|nr:hypothetical protein [Anaerolineae bacterium]
MLRQVRILTLVLVVLTLLPGVLSAQENAAPADVVVQHTGLYPEGIAYDAASDRFFISSMTEGTVYAVTGQGELTPFIQDTALVSSVGLHADAEHGRLLVTNSDIGAGTRSSAKTQGRLAAIGSYDLTSGEPLAYYDLGALLPDGAHVANDIAVDADGNIYVTDSFSPVIYRISADGEAEVLLQSDLFVGDGFNLNGIVYHPDGYLIVAKYNEGKLFKVPVSDPTTFTEISSDSPYSGVDGLVLLPDGDLVVITNVIASGAPTNRIYRIRSTHGWESAQVISDLSTATSNPTTGVMRGDQLYVLFGGLDRLFNPNNTVPADTFHIRSIWLNG